MDNRNLPGTRRFDRMASAGGHARLDGGVIEVVAGPHAGRSFLYVPPKVRLGSRIENDIVLADDTVSRHHAVIEETPQGLLLRDAGSTNGVYVGAARIREAYLEPGQIFSLGATSLVLKPHSMGPEIVVAHPDRFGLLLGASDSMRKVYDILRCAAATDLNILVTGETGTGKELVARSLHQESPRSKGPFVVFDGSAVSRDLIESTLFGHRQGAFTGAQGERKGAFQSAHGGTLLIDELGELPLELQPRLLRVLETRLVQPLGSDRTYPVDVRVIAVTNRNLKEMVLNRTFRQDLYYRLSVIQVILPPLRDRREDIPMLVREFLSLRGVGASSVSESAWTALMSHSWAGNVRELRNVLDRAAALSGGQTILPTHIALEPAEAGSQDSPPFPAVPATPASSGDTERVVSLEEAEARAIRNALRVARWNKSEAARILGLNRKTLRQKIEKFGIEP